MKISASIYSDKKRSLKDTINDLRDHHVDLLHIDCNDDLSVFDDIAEIRELTDIPLDLHIISNEPEKFYSYLESCPVDYVTFQYENISGKLNIPTGIRSKKGLAVTTNTAVSVFDDYSDFDFILIMATTPGQSGGVFDPINFKKIRDFKAKYPSKNVHVDGGVNPEVSFILRNMGVTASVSGSYLFNEPSVGQALMNLTKREIESHFLIRDFMIPLSESPFVLNENLQFETVLRSIEDGKLGFTLVLDKDNDLKGLVSNADVRKGLLRHIGALQDITGAELINPNAIRIEENKSVLDMLQLIKETDFPIMYLPVVDKENKAVGILTFVNLVKGEL